MNRPLGASELVLWRQAQLQPINVVFRGHLEGPLEEPRLRAALDAVRRRHALLAARIQLEGARPHFVWEGVPGLPLRVVPRRDARDWLREAEEELIRPFEQAKGPLLRVVWLRGDEAHDVLLCFDHCLGDGMSAAFLLRDLLDEVAQPGSRPPLPVPAACEALLPAGLSTPPLAPPPSGTLEAPRPELPRLSRERDSQVLLLADSLSEQTLARLGDESRRERTSVHGALCAAYLLSLARELNEAGALTLAAMSPVNLREHLVPPGGESFAAYYSRQRTLHRVEARSGFWELARDVREQLRAATSGAHLFSHLLQVRDFLATEPSLPAYQAFMRARIGSELTVTNLGRVELGERFGPLSLRAMDLTVSGLAPLIVGVVTTGGRMNVSSRFLTALISPASARRIHDGALEWLRAPPSASHPPGAQST